MQGSLSATLPHARGMEHEQTRMLEGEKNNAGRDSESWIIMSRHYNWTSRIPYLFSPALPRPPPTRKLSVLLRIKISSKSYGRLQTNRAVSFPTGCRNFRRLSTFPTALATTSHSTGSRSNTSFYTYPRPTATICKVKQSCFFILSTLSHTLLLYSSGSENK